jgi:serine/threonine-protein kinase
VIHRDIKPENILLHQGEPMVADFGVALAAASAGRERLTETGLSLGTPAYMSPEQASAEPRLDGRTDQYSLACVVYEMLAGEPPYTGPTAQAIIAKRLSEPVPHVGTLRAVPPGVEAAITRALARSPADRFASVTEFVNASADPENEYFSDGMTEELITALTKVEGLHVASRTSVFAVKGAREDVRTLGARLNVSAVLEGSVRRAGNRLRITAQLTSVRDGRTLWSERYDRELADVFAIQDEIARTIVDTLRATLLQDLGDPTPVRYTANLRAYTLYLKGRFSWNRRTQADIAQGIKYFEEAIAEDAGYALAYTGLADSYALQLDYRGSPVQEGLERARAEAQRALALDETLAEAHTSLAWVTFIYDWDWPLAATHFRRALELNPRYSVARQWHSWFQIAMGHPELSLAEGRQAIALDPASVSIRRSMGWLHYYARQPEQALEQLRRALAMNPTAEENHRLIGLSYVQMGLLEEAEAAFREAIAASESPALAKAGLGVVAAGRGRPEQARDILAELAAQRREGYVSPVAFVMLHTALGEAEQAFAWLDRAYEERRGWLVYLGVEPTLDSLRGDPRFRRLMERMRLV